ncbi:MAG TPA: hypothetical protein VHY34_10850 [Caulobacteraceae bacterium]|jgi:hypothetical protein|nr:hypothetical protein [Caulobacteraceae bacterium]
MTLAKLGPGLKRLPEMRSLRWLCLLVSLAALAAPLAHVLELPNKLRLDGPLWLAVQQHLYNGWGPIIGAPTEIGGLLLSLAALTAGRRERRALAAYGVAAVAFLGMLFCFFVFNDPVNKALAPWTPATLPADWMSYRWRWELGHALAALCALIAVVASGVGLMGAKKGVIPDGPKGRSGT